MKLPIIAIDTNVEVHLRQTEAWARHGISVTRVESVLDAIKMVEKSNFLFIGINADNIDYLSQLNILCNMTTILVLIITSSYSVKEHNMAVKAGALAFGQWDKDNDTNVEAALSILDSLTQLEMRHKKAVRILHHENLLIVMDYKEVFINEIKIDVTKTEYEILLHLRVNRGHVVSTDSIRHHVWGDPYEHISENTLWTHIKNLRKKLLRVSPNCNYIENVRGICYKFRE